MVRQAPRLLIGLLGWACAAGARVPPPAPSDPLALFPPECPSMGWAVWWQMVEHGLHGTAGDLILRRDGVVPWMDALIEASLPEGGVVLLGESHREVGIHSLLRDLLWESEVVDCLLLEHPAIQQAEISAYVAGAPCEESWGAALRALFGEDTPTCGRDLRTRMLDHARHTGTPVFVVDACTTCPPYDAVLGHAAGEDELSPEDFTHILLADRNAYMAQAITDLWSEGRCTRAVLLTGRFHVEVPESLVVTPVVGVGDLLRAAGVPAVDWLVFDVAGELRDTRERAPDDLRFVLGPGGVRALFLE